MNDELSGLIKDLQQACTSKNWEQLKLLDQTIKSYLQRSVELAQTEQQKLGLASDLKSIQDVYQLVIDESGKHQLGISVELKKITSDQRAAKSYLGVSRF